MHTCFIYLFQTLKPEGQYFGEVKVTLRMSYGSAYVQFEAANGRISHKFSRPSFKKDDDSDRQQHKIVHYEKQFDVNLSRVDEQPIDKASVRKSMLNYSKKMRTLQDSRYNSSGNSKGNDPLFVRAKHIPKYPTRTPKKRRPMSFDELLGRDRDVDSNRPNGAKARPKSDKIKQTKKSESKSDNELHLPLLTERLRKSGPNVHVSLVSASDLYDIVDFSLRSKGTRNDSLQMLRMEQEEDSPRSSRSRSHRDTDNYQATDPYNRFERTSNRYSDSHNRTQERLKNVQKYFDSGFDDNTVPSVEFYEDIFAMEKTDTLSQKPVTLNNIFKLPSIEPFKRRPQRAKRMKLVDPELDDIPEDNVIESQTSSSHSRRETARANSPTPQKSSPRPQETNKFSLDAIQENVEKVSVRDSFNSNTVTNESFRDLVDNRETRHYQKGSIFPSIDDSKSTKKLLRDDGDVRIEVTQCPPKQDANGNTKLKAQKKFKKLIFLRDAPR